MPRFINFRAGRLLLAGFYALSPFVLAAQSFGHGTAEVIITSKEEIVAVIDSKEVNHLYLSDGSSLNDERIACKVRRTGPNYVLVAGVSRGPAGFDTLRAAADLYRAGESLDDYAGRLEDGLSRPLAQMMEAVRAVNPLSFKQAFHDQEVLQLTALGVEHDLPRVVIVTFRASQSGLESATGGIGITTRRMSCPGDCERQDEIYLLGTHEEAGSFLAAHPEAFDDTRTSRALEFIEREYVSRPDVVGGPATVIRVTANGTSLEQAGACAAEDRLRQIISELDRTIAGISNIVVHEEVDQHSRRGRELKTETVSATVRVVDGRDEYDWGEQNANRLPQPSRQRVPEAKIRLPQPWCGGGLATILQVTRETLARGQNAISAETPGGVAESAPEATFVIAFHAAESDRHWQLLVDSRTYPVAFDGKAWFSEATGKLLRIHWETAELRLPASTGISWIEWDETFATNDVAGWPILTPSTSTYRIHYAAQIDRTDWTETRFTDFRRFGSTETVRFETSSLR